MKLTRSCILDCLKQLLPNIAATGLWEQSAAWSGPVLAGLGLAGAGTAVLPVGLSLACIAAYVGLQRRGSKKSEDEEQRDLQAALKIIRKRSKNAEEELVALGFQVKMNFENVHLRLTGLDQAIKGLSDKLDGRFDSLEELLADHFSEHRDDLETLYGLIEINFDCLRSVVEGLPDSIEQLQSEHQQFKAQLDRVEGKIDEILRIMTEDQAQLQSHNAELQGALTQAQSEIDILQASSRDALRSIIEAAESGDDQASDAITTYESTRDVEAFKRFFDRFIRVGDDVADRAIEEAEEASRLAQRAIAHACDRHRQRAALMLTIGDIDRAYESLQKVLRLRADDLDAINRLGTIYFLRGDLAAAETRFRSLLTIPSDEVWIKSLAFGNLGVIAQTRGDLDGAEKLHREALEINRGLGRLEGQASCLGNLGVIAHIRGDLDGAEKLYREVLEINRGLGRLEGQASCLGNLGVIAKTRGDLDGARVHWGKAKDLFDRVGIPQSVKQVQDLIDGLGDPGSTSE